ncbi:MAG: hypothetical protein LBO74_05665, partial [Candidatus Symbiothrix sp.]|nr:hypothetical protein [Candidatus Symbiothrix sp.]
MKIRKIKGENVFTSFLKLLGVKHTNEFSNKYFNEHPHKYNLFGLSKMLSDYGIANAGTKIQDKETDLFNIELPFIAHLGSEFVVVYKIDTDKVHYLWNGKNISIPVDDFLQAWTGIILLAEPNSNSIEPGYKEHKKKELLNSIQKYLLLFAGSLLLVLTGIKNSLFTNLGLSLLIILNLLGIYIGYLLVQKQLHIHSKYADKICSLFSKSDCNNVLESKAAKLWGIFGWSEIGLGYFVANVLIFIFLPSFVDWLALLNILALPYSVWSVWYQKFKAKQWCTLCLTVQALLWGIFILNYVFEYIQIPELQIDDLSNLAIVVCIYVIMTLGINIIVPVLSKNRIVKYLRQELNSLKANEDVFKVFLKKQAHYAVNKSDSQILFGDPDAGLRITVLTNPFCNPCAGMHKRIEKFLKDTNDTVYVQYIFSSFDQSLNFANKNLIAAYQNKDTETVKQIFNDWFEKGKTLKEEFF